MGGKGGRRVESKVIEKVQKLLALSGSSNAFEAQEALLKAQMLLAKHNLTMSDLPAESRKEAVVEEPCVTVSAYNQWVRELAEIVARNFRCSTLVSHWRNRFRMVFVGFETDAKVAAQVFEYASKYADRCGTNLAQTYSDKGLPSKGVKQDYVDGFVKGLKLSWQKQALEHKECSLMLVIPVQVEEHLKQYEVGIFRAGYQPGSGNREAFRKGYESGKQFAKVDRKAIGK